MRAIVFTGKNDASFTRLPDPAPTPLRARGKVSWTCGQAASAIRIPGIVKLRGNSGFVAQSRLGLANALTAIGGALFAQVFGGADVYAGTGVIITGLASVIIGTSVFLSRTMVLATLACVLGSITYRAAVGFALNADTLGLRASDLQLVTAVLVAGTLIVQSQRAGLINRYRSRFRKVAYK